MGLGGVVNKDRILPKIKGKDLPFHSAAALPVAILLGLCTFAFAQVSGLTHTKIAPNLIDLYLLISGISLTFRGLFGFIFFHIFNRVIDDTPFKTWDLRLYSPLTLYLGIHCLVVLI